MKVLITGTSSGIGKAIALLFLEKSHEVHGIDRLPSEIKNENYNHYQLDIRDRLNYPQIEGVEILINNAGCQNEDDININLSALIDISEHYGVQEKIKAILNIGSASGHSGLEFPRYCASKGGVISYTKNLALRLAKYGACCNSLDPGGVITESNAPVMKDPALWQQIMDLTPLRRWASVEEISAWAYFLTVENSFCTGQSIVIDGGESINGKFVWPE